MLLLTLRHKGQSLAETEWGMAAVPPYALLSPNLAGHSFLWHLIFLNTLTQTFSGLLPAIKLNIWCQLYFFLSEANLAFYNFFYPPNPLFNGSFVFCTFVFLCFHVEWCKNCNPQAWLNSPVPSLSVVVWEENLTGSLPDWPQCVDIIKPPIVASREAQMPVENMNLGLLVGENVWWKNFHHTLFFFFTYCTKLQYCTLQVSNQDLPAHRQTC